MRVAVLGRNGVALERAFGSASRKDISLELTFEATTNVPPPYEVYWQVVNSGPEAEAVPGGLRGGFDRGIVERGSIKRVEHTEYAGMHTIECFIVKSGYLAANSGPFVVNIK